MGEGSILLSRSVSRGKGNYEAEEESDNEGEREMTHCEKR